MDLLKIITLIFVCSIGLITTQSNSMSTSQRTVRAERRSTNRDLPERERILSIQKEEALKQIQLLKSILFIDQSPATALHVKQEVERLSEISDPKLQRELIHLRQNINFLLEPESCEVKPLPDRVASTELK